MGFAKPQLGPNRHLVQEHTKDELAGEEPPVNTVAATDQMWRQNSFPINDDSDQSISDEDDLDGDLGENCVSLAEKAEKEEVFQLQSRLDMLRGKEEPSFGGEIGVQKKQRNFSDEDEVEIPDFPDGAAFISSQRKKSVYKMDDDIIFNEEKSHKDNQNNISGSQKQDRTYPWSVVQKEAEALFCLNKNILTSSSTYKYDKGGKGKFKPKFSFHYQLNKEGSSASFIFKDESHRSSKVNDPPERLETINDGTLQYSSPEPLDDPCGENENHTEIIPAEVDAIGKGFIEHSMAEILDGLQHKNVMPRGNSKMSCRKRGERRQLAVKKSMSLLGDRTIENDGQPEFMDSGSSSDDYAKYQHEKLSSSEMKGKSMADQFHDALAATSLRHEGTLATASKLSSVGLFGKLQQVMHREKLRDADFLKKIQKEASPNAETRTMVVKILSRYLDGKLTVCHFGENMEGSQTVLDCRMKRRIIFNPRVCSDVDLEIGNWIRIYPPWFDMHLQNIFPTIRIEL